MTQKQRIRVIADYLQEKGYFLSDKYAMKYAKKNKDLFKTELERKLKRRFGF
jgi:hypothetical protein